MVWSIVIHATLTGPRSALLCTLKQSIYFFRIFSASVLSCGVTQAIRMVTINIINAVPCSIYSIIPMLLLEKLKLCFLPFANDGIPVSLALQPFVTF